MSGGRHTMAAQYYTLLCLFFSGKYKTTFLVLE